MSTSFAKPLAGVIALLLGVGVFAASTVSGTAEQPTEIDTFASPDQDFEFDNPRPWDPARDFTENGARAILTSNCVWPTTPILLRLTDTSVEPLAWNFNVTSSQGYPYGRAWAAVPPDLGRFAVSCDGGRTTAIPRSFWDG